MAGVNLYLWNSEFHVLLKSYEMLTIAADILLDSSLDMLI